MDFYDSLIDNVRAVLEGFEKKEYAYDSDLVAPCGSHSEVILQRDCAFELKGSGFNLITGKAVTDGVTVIGDDLGFIREDTAFARISLIETESFTDEQKAYNAIRKIEYVKYHLFPEGYMMRSASRSHKEAVRVGKKEIAKGLSFQRVGNLFISKYKENPSVKAVRIIFVTHKAADYKALAETARRSNDITEALNHIMNSVKFDCDSCNLKAVCDEVEGMKELHFKTAMKGRANDEGK